MKPTYEYSSVTAEQKKMLDGFNGEFYTLDCSIRAQIPEGRYRALALTSLEESAMWASKAISKA